MWGVSEEMLLAGGGHEFFEVERLEVGHVTEVPFAKFTLSRLEHRRGLRASLDEMCVRVSERVCALRGSISDEENRSLSEDVAETVAINDFCLGISDARAVSFEYGRIDFHPACIYHRDYVFECQFIIISLPLKAVRRMLLERLVDKYLKCSYAKQRNPGPET